MLGQALAFAALIGANSARGQQVSVAASLVERPTPADVRSRRLRSDYLSEAQYADAQKLLGQYAETFRIIGRARRCGLDWQKPHDEFMRQLQRRHGPDMDRGYGPTGDWRPGLGRGHVEMGLSDGGQGPESMFAGGSPTCREAASQLASLRLPDLPKSLALPPGERPAPRLRQRLSPNDDLIVSPDSRFARSIYQQPVASDPSKLLVVRQILLIAGDDEAVWALDRYLERSALLALFGERFSPTVTVEKIILDEPAADWSIAKDLRTRALARSLQPRMAQSDGKECAASPFRGECKYVGHSVWSDYWIYLRVMVENTSGFTISKFDARLRFQPTEGQPLELDECRSPSQRAGQELSLSPGQQGEHFCRDSVRKISLERLLGAIQEAEKDPSRWNLEVGSINFTQPPIFLNPDHAGWSNPRATEEATAAVRAVSCFERGACIEAARHEYANNPYWPIGTIGLILGALEALGIRRFARRQVAVASISSICFVVGVAALWWWTFFGGGAFAGLFLAYYGSFWLLFYLVGLWATLLALNLFRSKRPPAPA